MWLSIPHRFLMYLVTDVCCSAGGCKKMVYALFLAVNYMSVCCLMVHCTTMYIQWQVPWDAIQNEWHHINTFNMQCRMSYHDNMVELGPNGVSTITPGPFTACCCGNMRHIKCVAAVQHYSFNATQRTFW